MMFKRTWFFHVESIPTLIEARRSQGKITRLTGFVSYRSLFVNYVSVRESLLKKIERSEEDFNNGEYMLVSMSRV
jgi:hypothetical protein